ncbi:Trihydroxynaphthalene reductase [Entomophthora muscae]|uniref:Trihydroxynaphthalene reductase n=1 Tax=Entomophthora muscae TaxID=34485 RepID=A0ACC2RX38_9FUNG|nr:Trihydroxynaphthalene reductase [Entomophthora muscae]
MKFHLKIPATSANLGPGFDTLGLALSLFLTIDGTFSVGEEESCTFEFEGDGKDELTTDPEENLITQTALYVLRSLGNPGFGGNLKLKINNQIPLGRGLGSSGAAVVGGVLLGDIIGGFKLPQSRLLDFIIAVERHPDNVVPCLVGGFVASYVRNTSLEINLKSQDSSQIDYVPSSEKPTDSDTSARNPPLPPQDAVRFVQLPIHKSIRAVAVIPAYHLATSKARGVLPSTYEKSDVIFNLQRLAVLTQALGEDPPSSDRIFGAMTDKLHQPYRKHLIPGLPHALETLSPLSHPGLLGICLSGAGPTVLALATSNFQSIGNSIKSMLDLHGNTDCQVMTLDIFTSGSQISIEQHSS